MLKPVFTDTELQLLATVAALAMSYAVGCFSAGYYLVRWRTGQDIRTLGSGATGGRNVGRLLGPRGFAVTMFFDLIKGSLAVWFAGSIGLPPSLLALAVTAVVAGHIWPLQLGLRGGKGLATVLGAMLVLDPRFTVLVCVSAILIGFVLKRYSVGVLVAVALAPSLSLVLGYDWTSALMFALTALAILAAHRDNIAAALGRKTGRPG